MLGGAMCQITEKVASSFDNPMTSSVLSNTVDRAAQGLAEQYSWQGSQMQAAVGVAVLRAHI